MLDKPLYIHALLAFIAAGGFGFLFTVDKKNLFLSAITGTVAWTLSAYLTLVEFNYVFSTLLSAIAVGVLSEIFAIIKKTPATNFVVIGIIPLVPGFKVYKAMLFFLQDKVELGIHEGIKASFIAVSIGLGLMVSLSFCKLIKNMFHQKSPNKEDA